MKTLLKIIIIILLLGHFLCPTVQAQQIALNTQVDNIAIQGDKNGDRWDIITRVELQGIPNDYGYLFVFPQYQYFASSYAPLQRFSAGVGYSFNWLGKSTIEPQINYGRILRFGRAFRSWDAGCDVCYKVWTLKACLSGSITQRQDIPYMWGGNTVWRFNGRLGIQIPIYKLKARR